MEILDRAVLLGTVLAEIYMLYDFFSNSFSVREPFRGKWKLIPTLLMIVIVWCLNSIGNTWLNLFGLTGLMFLYTMVVFEAGIWFRLLYVFLVALTIFSGEFVLMLLLEVPPRVMKLSAVTNLTDIFWQTMLAKLISFVILKLVEQLAIKGRHRMPGKIFWLFICQPFVSVTAMLTAYYGNLNETVTESFGISMTVCSTLLLFSNILIFYAFNQYSVQMAVNADQKLALWKWNADAEYYDRIEEMNQKQRALIHDITHYSLTIKELAASGQSERIAAIAEETMNEVKQISAMVYCHNPVLNAILNEKKRDGETKGIAMHIYVEPGADMVFVNDRDMITMLGNLLANAIRAASECGTDAYVSVNIYRQNHGQSCVTKVENSFAENRVQVGDRFVSTRREEGVHGIGLRNVEETAEKYQGFLTCDAEEHKFTAMLVLSDIQK